MGRSFQRGNLRSQPEYETGVPHLDDSVMQGKQCHSRGSANTPHETASTGVVGLRRHPSRPTRPQRRVIVTMLPTQNPNGRTVIDPAVPLRDPAKVGLTDCESKNSTLQKGGSCYCRTILLYTTEPGQLDVSPTPVGRGETQ
jgi:hypothetical protein